MWRVLEVRWIMTMNKHVVSIFVDRSSSQWVVLDPDGLSVPPIEQGWEHREPFTPTADRDLEPVPKHYTYMLGIPY
jgi:hypothetical protein